MLPNTPQCVIAYYAALWLGAVVVMTNPLYVERELISPVDGLRSGISVRSRPSLPKAEKVLPETGIRTVIATSIKDYLPVALRYLYPIKARLKKLFTSVPFDGTRVVSFKKMIDQNRPEPIACAAEPDGLALLQYTGGTTGISKGAMLTHRNIVSNVVQLTTWFPDLNCGKERFLSVLPFFHAFGLDRGPESRHLHGLLHHRDCRASTPAMS